MSQVRLSRGLDPGWHSQSIEIFKHKGKALNNGYSFPLSRAWVTALSGHWTLVYNRNKDLSTENRY